MIVLDTNVISELMSDEPSSAVTEWLARNGTADLRTTSVCQAEILAGLAVMPHGRRKDRLTEAATILFEREFEGRVLFFDSVAAYRYAEIVAARRLLGRPVQPLDAMIAAVARAHGAAVATRNVADFRDCGIVVRDPWSEL